MENYKKTLDFKVKNDPRYRPGKKISRSIDDEIEKYRLVLEKRFEALPPQSKKRKTSPKNGSKKMKKTHSSNAPRVQPAVNIVGLDLEEDCVFLENVSKKRVHMEGYTVCDKHRNKVITFEPFVLEPRGRLVVISKKRNNATKVNMQKHTTIFIVNKTSWDVEGDCAFLMDANDILVSRFYTNMSLNDAKKIETKMFFKIQPNKDDSNSNWW